MFLTGGKEAGMTPRRSRFKDSQRNMTLALVTVFFSAEGIDGEVALACISRYQRLFTVRVLYAEITPQGRAIMMVLGIPSQELGDREAEERCSAYDKALAEEGFSGFCGFPAVEPRRVWRRHTYTGAQLNAPDCLMHDLSWGICHDTWLRRRRTAGDLAPRPCVRGKYTCQRLDPLNMPRFFDSRAMDAMRSRLAAAGCSFQLNWSAPRIVASRNAVGSMQFVMGVEGIEEPPRNRREAKRTRSVHIYTDDARWHLYKHALYIYGDRLKAMLGDQFFMEFAQVGLDALGRTGTSLEAQVSRATGMVFSPVLLSLCLSNGLFRWLTQRRLQKNGTLQRLWEESFRLAQKDYAMPDAPTPPLP